MAKLKCSCEESKSKFTTVEEDYELIELIKHDNSLTDREKSLVLWEYDYVMTSNNGDEPFTPRVGSTIMKLYRKYLGSLVTKCEELEEKAIRRNEENQDLKSTINDFLDNKEIATITKKKWGIPVDRDEDFNIKDIESENKLIENL